MIKFAFFILSELMTKLPPIVQNVLKHNAFLVMERTLQCEHV